MSHRPRLLARASALSPRQRFLLPVSVTGVYPLLLPDGRRLGAVPVDAVTREMLGAVIPHITAAGRSMAISEGVRSPFAGTLPG